MSNVVPFPKKPLEQSSRDPVYREWGKWYFYDETWTDTHGPFEDEEQAREALAQYCKEFL